MIELLLVVFIFSVIYTLYPRAKSHNRRLVLFDFDGTIADSFDNAFNLLNELSEKWNYQKFTREQAKELTLIELIKITDVSKYKIPFILKELKQKLRHQTQQIELFPGMANALKSLKEDGFDLMILSSNDKNVIERFLSSNEISNLFDKVVSDSSLFGKDKPINRLIKKTGYKIENTIYVGDEVRDFQACHKSGLKMVAVTWGFDTKARLQQANATLFAETAHQLPRIITKYFNSQVS